MNPEIDELMHYGIKRRSGRYPWGSGENPYQHEAWFLNRLNELRKQNLSDEEIADSFGMTPKQLSSQEFLATVHKKRDEGFEFKDSDGTVYTKDNAIAKSMGLTTTQFRTKLSLATNEKRKHEVERAKELKAEGKSGNEIAAIMGYNSESSIRSLLNANSEARMISAEKTADFLKKQVDEKGMIDVGVGVERQLNVSRERLNQALYILSMEGYPVWGGGIPQVTNPGKQSNVKVLCPPGTEHKEIYDWGKVHSIADEWVSHDGGDTFDPKWKYPESLSSKRIAVRYGEDGGGDKEGVVELRRGVKDLDLGGSHYAQVRILVDGTHYIKGMAVYADDKDLPDGVDVLINTKKSSNIPLIGESKDKSILKPIKNDPTNPFGALIKEGINDPEIGTTGGGQSYYIDSDGKKKLSVINKKSDEGDWMEWSDTLPSQFLAKQSQKLIDRQLKIAMEDKKAELDSIRDLNNAVVRKKYLKDFAEDCDAAAIHLKAAALPRQKYQVLMPLTTIKDDEVYAPNYENGEKVALIRYPHGGTFEIPILTVNNKNAEGKRVFGTAPKDLVGVNKKVADRLSGADFDGDTVMVLPCNSPRSSVKIVSTTLKDIEGFDDQLEYGGRPEGSFKKMKNTQTEMGIISNLIMDMTLKGASEEELARAVKHSMVVIDAEKHNLDYKASEEDFGIKDLKRRYQGHYDADGNYHEGASTLITRAKSEVQVLKTKGSPIIDPETGKVSYKRVVETYTDKDGKTKVRTQKSTQMAETDDAFTLSTGTPQEEAYAEYANYMKTLANEARKEMVNTPNPSYSPSAKVVYDQEVKSLDSKLNIALMNAPRERRAQAIANSIVAQKKKDYPELTLPKNKKDLKKVKNQALVEARARTGAKRDPFTITDKEWEAIQAGAVSANKLSKILNHMDADILRQYATPYENLEISPAKQAKIRNMAMSGYTPSEIASMVGVSTTTVNKYIGKKP